MERREAAQELIALRQAAVLLELAAGGGEVDKAGVFLVSLRRVERFELGERARLLAAHESGAQTEALSSSEQESFVATRGLADDADVWRTVLTSEFLDLDEGRLDRAGTVWHHVLDRDESSAVLELAEEVERSARDVGSEEERGFGLVRGGCGGDIDGARRHGDLGR